MEVRVIVKRILVGWVFLLFLVALLGRVSVAETNAGRTAADFLLIGVGARAAGMGGAYTALSEGAVASYWNPSGLTTVEGGQVLLGHFSWYQDLSLEHGTFAYQANDVTTVAASITFLNYGTVNGYDLNGEYTSDITVYDWSGAVSVGYKINENLSVGSTVKYINQKLDDISGSTFATDLGIRYNKERFTVAGFLGNIGPDMKFDSEKDHLPSSGRVGVAVYPFNNSFLTAVEFEKMFYGGTIIRQGFEFNYNSQYFIRTGYNYFPADENRSFGNGITLGAGVRLNKAEFDYAYTPSEKYSTSDLHRISVVFKFGN